jgi:hypothetical protein
MRSLHAQSWNITGNTGLTASNFLGSTDNHNVIFKANNAEFGRIAATGFWRFGDAVNFARIDTSGKLTFGGNGAYQVAGNKYVFQYTGNLNQGLFFNSTSVQYEFRNGSAVPVFTVNANTGNSVFNGTVKLGAYTLPSIDGTSGQVLTTNGGGAVSWSNVSLNSRANTSLSNLAATTAINAALLPKTNNSISLGSSGSGWTNIYIDSALYIGGTKFLTGNASLNNTGVGLNALSANTTGYDNTATGFQSLHANTSGSLNTANGLEALYSNTTGNYNTANGLEALFFNTTGSENTANGQAALYSNTTGNYNAANGYKALYSNTTGTDNTATGGYALTSNTTGNYNTANGVNALLSNTTGYQNTANGQAALYSNTTGNYNTANGQAALFSNTTGSDNTANRFDALYSNTTGSVNTANGFDALYSNTTGNFNTANGQAALFSNTTGSDNTANGFDALDSNTTGNGNTANGFFALSSNTTGSDNTANGIDALADNTTGDNNAANGFQALIQNTTGSYNTANGYDALYDNTTGNYNTANGFEALLSNTTGNENTANGDEALYYNTTGGYNTANGYLALFANSTGNENTAIGEYALFFNSTGNENTAIGEYALNSNTTGSENTALGDYADVPFQSDLINATAIGNGALVDASNKVRIGNTFVSSIGGQVGWTTFSDGRYKKNIKEDVQGLKFINLLKPITYTVDINGLNSHYNNLRKHDSTYDKTNAQMQPSADAASKIIYNGFIAQDVEKAAQSISYNFSGVDKPQNKDGLYGLRYADFVVPLVKSVQELSKLNDDKNIAIDSLKQQNADLQHQMNDLKALVLQIQQHQQSCACSASVNSGTVQQYNVALSNAASLEQNIPNPFTNATTIGYTLPQKFSSAQIIIADKNGKVLKQLNLSGAGKGFVRVDAAMLASGAYSYALYVDGKMIDSKQMVLAK